MFKRRVSIIHFSFIFKHFARVHTLKIPLPPYLRPTMRLISKEENAILFPLSSRHFSTKWAGKLKILCLYF